MPPDLFRLALLSVPLTTDWEPLIAPKHCTTIECIGDANWSWATEDEGEDRVRLDVNSGIYHTLVDHVVNYVPKNSTICYVKSQAGTGTLWVKTYW